MSRSVSHLVFCLIMPAPRFCTPVTIGIAFARAIYLDSRYSNLQIWTIYFLRNEDLMTHHQPTTDGPKPAVKSVAVNYINYDFNPHLISISFLSLSALSRPSSTVGDTRGTSQCVPCRDLESGFILSFPPERWAHDSMSSLAELHRLELPINLREVPNHNWKVVLSVFVT